MKKLIPIISLLFLLLSCEKADLNLTDENIENRLKSMVGENITSVGNRLKSEGFQKFKFDEQINYIKGVETYLFTTSNKIVVSAGYQTKDSTKVYSILDKYHYSFTEKETEIYSGEIYSTDFSDWGNSYVDSINVGNNNYIYIYDNPTLFYSALQSNLYFLIYSSESWHSKKDKNGEMWNIQLGEKAKSICITYSDFSIKQ
ncbi:MAG: hypothetical protein IKW17_00565 [Paludibacteraceae bacterium]|nr:hypothetical protein [Paludibacteraceae bacterium]